MTGYIVTASSPGLPSVRDLAATRPRPSSPTCRLGHLGPSASGRVRKRASGCGAVAQVVSPGLGNNGYLVVTTEGAVLGFGDVTSHGGVAGEGDVPVGFAATPPVSATGW